MCMQPLESGFVIRCLQPEMRVNRSLARTSPSNGVIQALVDRPAWAAMPIAKKLTGKEEETPPLPGRIVLRSSHEWLLHNACHSRTRK